MIETTDRALPGSVGCDRGGASRRRVCTMIGLMNSGSQMSLGSYASQVSATSTVKAERRRLAVERLEETAIELRKWLRSATKSLKHELYEDAARCVALARAVDAPRDTTY